MTKKAIINVLAVFPSLIPTSYILILKPLANIYSRNEINLKVKLEFFVNKSLLEWADIVIFSRCVNPRNNFLIDTLNHLNKPFIYDIDDNFFDIPNDTDLGRYLRNPNIQSTMSRFFLEASLVRVYSKEMDKKGNEMGANTKLVNAPVDLSLISSPHISANRKIRIVYATSRTRDDYLATLFLPALQHIITSYPEVEVHCWGNNPFGNQTYKNLFFHPFIRDYDRFMRKFSSQGYDIGLAPLLDDEFNRSKSNVKYREYGACRIAGIYSKVNVYSDWIRNNENGVLVENTESEWFNAIQTLIEHSELRNEIREQAYNEVSRFFSQREYEDFYLKQIVDVINNPNMHSNAHGEAKNYVGNVGLEKNNKNQNIGIILYRFLRSSVKLLNRYSISLIFSTLHIYDYLFWKKLKRKRSRGSLE